MIGYQHKINQILRGAETIKNMNDDIGEVKSFAKHFKERAEELYAENQILMKALKHLVIVAQKDEINKDHLDQALRKARNVIADIDPTVEKCDCCY